MQALSFWRLLSRCYKQDLWPSMAIDEDKFEAEFVFFIGLKGCDVYNSLLKMTTGLCYNYAIFLTNCFII